MNQTAENGEMNENYEIWIENKWIEIPEKATGDLVVYIPFKKEDVYVVDRYQWKNGKWKVTPRSLWENIKAYFWDFIDVFDF